jgi:hypothetical protein
MTIKWITPAGSLGTITERVPIDILLEAESSIGEKLQYSIISGSLPRGVRLIENSLRGSPSEVRIFTTSRFVVRATDGVSVEDRTFSISVDGSDAPEWITKEGFLQVGKGKSFFVLDNAKVNFQLEATDPDLVAGDVLEFYLMPMGGELPPGLSLSKSGLISGFTDPIFAIDVSVGGEGGYDINPYDITPSDFREAKTNGFDSFFYDSFGFDYNEPSRIPRRLSRAYTFVVAVSDGLNVVTRIFRIYVVTEEFLKADNSIVQIGTNVFTADSADRREPIWITESNLGKFRANNYVTIFLEVYNPPTLPGSITYILQPKNPDNTPSEVPLGTSLDTVTGQLAGAVPYQARVTKSYKFTVTAVYFPSVAALSTNFKGDWNIADQFVVGDSVRFNGIIYIAIRNNRNRSPENTEFWVSSITSVDKTFEVDVFGEIDSAVNWISDSNLGTIKPNQPSTIAVEAESLLYGGKVVYEFVSGKLPPGITFLPNGVVQGKVKQFADNAGPGLLRFFEKTIDSDNVEQRDFGTTFDSGSTTFDQKFTFTVRARDAANFAKVDKTFFFTVDSKSDKTFANLFIKALQTKEKRLQWTNFITDVTIFVPDDLYRYGDPNFATQTEIKMLVYAGIESVEAVKYVQAMSRNHYRKRILFGDLKTAKAKDPITQETLYEVVYIDAIDELEKDGVSISDTIELRDNINSRVLVSYDNIRVDSDIPFVSDRDHQRVFPNSIKNMRSRIRGIGERDREYLPLWMRSIQDQGTFETGFVKALVLCYAKPGRAASVMARIRASGFDFKNIDFVADRYLIDIIDGEIKEQYLAFPQRDALNKLSNPSVKDQDSILDTATFDSDSVFFDNDSITFDQE